MSIDEAIPVRSVIPMESQPISASRAVFAAFLLAAVHCLAQADDQFRDYARDAAAAYEISAGSASKIELQPQSTLHWTNPVPEKQMRGEVFLWTDDRRPLVVLNVFKMNEGGGTKEYHEFCSLADVGLNATAPGNRNWSPTSSQIRMLPVPGGPLAAPNSRQRLTQMRELAARFDCRKTNRKGETQQLRLLTQPLVRYESKSHQVVDGGLFVFVEATDPEVFLLIELRADGDVPAWQYGFARMASVEMQASLADKKVWGVETLPYAGYRNRSDLPYTLLLVR